MKVAINPLQWESPQSDELLGELHDAGFGAVLAEPNGQGAAEYGELLARHGLAPAPGYFSAPLTSYPLAADTRASARRFAAEHAELGLSEACLADDMHRDRIAAPPSRHAPAPAYRLARICAAIDDIAGIWSEFGLTACVHNHVGSYIETEPEIDAVMRGTKLAAFCPDTGHLAWAGMNPLEIVERHSTRVRLAHVKDISTAVIAEGSARGWDYGATVLAGLWQEPGYGDIDLRPVLDALRDSVGWVIIEVDHSTVAPIESARRCARWVQRV